MRARLPLAFTTALVAFLLAAPAWAQSLTNRLEGVRQHAQKQAESGPDHLWVGIAVALAVATAVALAALWTLRRRPKS